MNIFDLLHEPIQLTPPIRMFSAFSGIGTQEMALKRITSDYEIVGYSEIDKYAIKSYHAIHGDVKAYGDITKITEIPPCDIFTWSFPCTDLSKAGKQKGMGKDTRSGLAYEVLRLVEASKDKPKVLIMENVPDLIQEKFVRQFGEIQLELEKLGYMNYVETLNAKNYGVAQNRNRVFMVSVLGDYSYSFPNWVKLEKRLKDYLEDEVDEKYYLSAKQLESIINPKYESMGIDRVNDVDDVCNAITTIQGGNREPKVFIPETLCINSKDGDGVYINRPHQKRGCVQDGMIQTLKTQCDDVGVVVDKYSDYSKKKIIGNIVNENDVVGVITANAMQSFNHDNCHMIEQNLKIRKLTPIECFRLMGISDDDFYKAQAVNSNSQLYKQAGNAIVVDVFEAILRKMIKEK